MLTPSRCQPDRTLRSSKIVAQSLLGPPACPGVAQSAPAHSGAVRFYWSEPRQIKVGPGGRFAGSRGPISLGLPRTKPATETTQFFRFSGAGAPASRQWGVV